MSTPENQAPQNCRLSGKGLYTSTGSREIRDCVLGQSEISYLCIHAGADQQESQQFKVECLRGL